MTSPEFVVGKIDHTELRPLAGEREIVAAARLAAEYHAATVCVPSAFVKTACSVSPDLKVCTVVGFPNGYASVRAKCVEAEQAIKDGATEFDAVINIGMLKNGNAQYLQQELAELRRATQGYVLKIIIETGLLTTEEKVLACRLVSDSSADFVKTSTGFNGGGATLEDIAILSANIARHVRIKASGGISDFAQAKAFLDAGCDRIGSSRLLGLLKQIKD